MPRAEAGQKSSLRPQPSHQRDAKLGSQSWAYKAGLGGKCGNLREAWDLGWQGGWRLARVQELGGTKGSTFTFFTEC